MRKSDIKTIKKAQQTVYFFDKFQQSHSALFVQLPSNTREHFLLLSSALKKLDFYVFNSLVKDHDTPNIFKSVTMVSSKNMKTWNQLDACIKTIKTLYPTAVIFFVKDDKQLVSVDAVVALCTFEQQSHLTGNIHSLLAPFLSAVLVNSHQSNLDLLYWLDNR